MTDKAAVEMPSPVTGRVVSITGQPGDMVAVGSELIAFEHLGRRTCSASPPQPAAAPRHACSRDAARRAEATGARSPRRRLPPLRGAPRHGIACDAA